MRSALLGVILIGVWGCVGMQDAAPVECTDTDTEPCEDVVSDTSLGISDGIAAPRFERAIGVKPSLFRRVSNLRVVPSQVDVSITFDTPWDAAGSEVRLFRGASQWYEDYRQDVAGTTHHGFSFAKLYPCTSYRLDFYLQDELVHSAAFRTQDVSAWVWTTHSDPDVSVHVGIGTVSNAHFSGKITGYLDGRRGLRLHEWWGPDDAIIGGTSPTVDYYNLFQGLWHYSVTFGAAGGDQCAPREGVFTVETGPAPPY